ncbi:MAG TPA: prepilin-type N-terminal cleavage/methylation domain-containing protein [Sedimentisphaerales bacterium]|nr:prepilin-type N-terminal cleavage/methylation domain-containing protein [Sedimentisphaerales bacterium]
MRGRKGFTLVEILIVVVILGILAAIVIPQFSNASTEARQASLVSDLQSARAAIELYKIQHKDDMPGVSASFEYCLTECTDIDGVASAGDPGDWGVYGPYLERIPTNPFNDSNSVRIDGAAAGADTDGWRFDSTRGDFQADDIEDCLDGTAHTRL